MQDWQLLRQYVDNGSQAAFAKLIERHMKPIYATCLREVHDTQLAEDLTQAVFLVLAKKAPSIRREMPLSGWLFNTARFAARNLQREEARRRAREQKAALEMQTANLETEATWREIDPALNDALAALGAKDREAILLRFYHELSMAETGESLGISEDAAKMRVSRALDRLRRVLAKSGIVAPAATLAVLLSAHAAEAMPEACAAVVMKALSTITAGGVASAILTPHIAHISEGVIRTMWMTKLKVAAAITAICLAGGGTVGVVAHTYGAGRTRTAEVRGEATAATTTFAAPSSTAAWREHGDPEALRLLDQMTAAHKALKSFSATVECFSGEGTDIPNHLYSHGHIAYALPNKIAITSLDAPGAAQQKRYTETIQAVYDGVNYYVGNDNGKKLYYKRNDRHYTDRPIIQAFGDSTMSRTMLFYLVTNPDPVGALFQAGDGETSSVESITVGQPGVVGGVPVDTVITHWSGSAFGNRSQGTNTFAIGKSDHLLRQYTLVSKDASGGHLYSQTDLFLKLEVNPRLLDSTFVFHPNPGDREVDEMEGTTKTANNTIIHAETAILTGRVVFEDGKPAAGIKVFVQMQDPVAVQLTDAQVGHLSERMSRIATTMDVTAPNGTYRFDNLIPAQYNVEVLDPGNKMVANAAEGVAGITGKTATVPNIILQSTGSIITGTVVDKATGRPLPGIGICSYGPERPISSSMCLAVKTDRSGKYQLHVAPGKNKVFIGDPIHAPTQAIVNVAEGESKEVNFEAVPR